MLLSATPTDDSFRLAISADSGAENIRAEIGVRADDSTESLFTVDNSGEIYLAQPSAHKLGDFFDIWQNNAGQAGNNPDAVLNDGQLLSHIEDGEKTVQMFVNGQVSTEFEDYVVQDDDQIVLVYGENPVLSLNTNYGPIVIELFEDATPITVNNFLNYVNDGDYLESFFHRSVEDFVIQGGGYTTASTTFTDTDQFMNVPTDAPIQNEPGISNLRGTFAMAKLGGDPNSATSQFFVNLADDNATTGASLDTQNGGFAVFGQILDMTTVDTIADLTITPAADIDTTINANDVSLYSELPLGTNNELVVIQTIAGQGTLSGVKYYDTNANGVYDTGDSSLADVRVYVDVNANGVHDAGEAWARTGEDGRYRLQVAAGEYDIRAEVTPGRVATVPPVSKTYRVSVLIGREQSGLDFGERLVSDPVHSDLGAVDFVSLPETDLAATRTYTFQTTHDGILTVDLGANDPESVTLILHDDQGNELAGSQLVDGYRRIDWNTTADATYTVRVTDISESFSLRIANLVRHDGTTVTVHGTAGADDFLFSAENSRNVTINGVRYIFGDEEVSVVNFDADKATSDTGSDAVRIEGSALAETLTSTFEGTELVPTMVFETNAGTEQPFTITATNFEQLLAWSRSGDADTAVFEDSPGGDKGKALPGENASLIRSKNGYGEFYRRAKLFEHVTFVGANSPADDTIVLFDAPGPDRFEANALTGESQLTTDSDVVCATSGFRDLLVRSVYENGSDTASLVDSGENDKFVGRPGKSRLYSLVEGNQFDIVIRNFYNTVVDFANGGYDKARLADSPQADQFLGTPEKSEFWGPGFKHVVHHAEEVSVTSQYLGDGDMANLNDTALNDLLRCEYDEETGGSVQLWTPDELGQMLYQLIGFETVDAIGTTGTNTAEADGADFVHLYGSWVEND